ncbi:hypothetical protein [Amycolatopsis keratiniphila]|uniref:Uncharacterized protein n=1 Tax=Amycolatopsis keratiniphila subsp. keratiniphila TaxID=227715 RepID=A0A1W2M200_9PSEU|nr:hypothetical protein [Amycolatopsis keratiniphila]ONF73927.1 hypothetical protein AVR91_0204140 [Amycolatopsis keratiniphila subsp. keratiniphila]
MARKSNACDDCGATTGQLHNTSCKHHPNNIPPTRIHPTVMGICGAHGKQNCELCTTAPRYEDDPQFWDQVLGDD